MCGMKGLKSRGLQLSLLDEEDARPSSARSLGNQSSDAHGESTERVLAPCLARQKNVQLAGCHQDAGVCVPSATVDRLKYFWSGCTCAQETLSVTLENRGRNDELYKTMVVVVVLLLGASFCDRTPVPYRLCLRRF